LLISLKSIHTLFVLEHNRYVRSIACSNALSDEELYQRGRKWIYSLIQSVTYNEYLPAMLGHPFPPYTGYDPTLNPGLDGYFSTVVFRVGHSQVTSYAEYYHMCTSLTTKQIGFFQDGTLVGESWILSTRCFYGTRFSHRAHCRLESLHSFAARALSRWGLSMPLWTAI
jgi:hypothetical protein